MQRDVHARARRHARSGSGVAANVRGTTTSNGPMPMARCNSMAWTDTEAEERLKVLVMRNCGDGGAYGAVRAADGDQGREALHGAQVVREAVAGDAARVEAQELGRREGVGARRQAPVQEEEGRGAAAREGRGLESARV